MEELKNDFGGKANRIPMTPEERKSDLRNVLKHDLDNLNKQRDSFQDKARRDV